MKPNDTSNKDSTARSLSHRSILKFTGGVGDLSREEQQARFGGTFAPTAVVELDGTTAELVGTFGAEYLPSKCLYPPIEQQDK